MMHLKLIFLALQIVRSSKYVPYFAALVHSESVKLTHGKWVPWYNITEMNDAGSPSYGAVKMKLDTIEYVCRLRGEIPPKEKDLKILDDVN
jgi:hypothetical protein